MNISKAIQRGDIWSLRANEHEIIEDVNDMCKNPSLEWENYITYWMAMHEDPKTATRMFKVFLNTCQTALKSNQYEDVMQIYAHPTMVAAVSRENTEILDLIKDYLDKFDVKAEMYMECNEMCSDKVLEWYNENFS